MKRILLGTTALLGAFTLAAPASAQQVTTKAPFAVTLDGFLNFYTGFVQDTNLPNGASGAAAYNGGQRTYDFFEDSRIIVDAHATADNGLKYGIFWRLNTDTNSTGQDRANLYFAGAYGRVELGDNKHAAYKLLHQNFITAPYAAPAGNTPGINGLDGNFVQARFVSAGVQRALPTFANFGDTPYTFGNATMVTYLTPVIQGFQFGITFAPDGANRGGQTVVRDRTTSTFSSIGGLAGAGGAAGGLFQTIWNGALTYTNKFSDIGVKAGFGYTYASAKGTQTAIGSVPIGAKAINDVNSYHGSLQLSYAGVNVGAGYTYNGKSALPKYEARTGAVYDPTEGQGWAAGASYVIGPWAVGGYYQHGTSAGSPFTAGATRLSVIEAGVSYLLAPGLNLYGNAWHYDLNDDGTFLGAGRSSSDGWVYLIGTGVNF